MSTLREQLRVRFFALLDQLLRTSGSGNLDQRGETVRDGRRLPARFDWIKYPDDQGHRSIDLIVRDQHAIAALDQRHQHATALVAFLTGSPVQVPATAFDPAAWHDAAIARRDVADGHAWAVADGRFDGPVIDSTPVVSYWVTLPDEETEQRIAIAATRLATKLAAMPADSTARDVWAVARAAWRWSYAAFDRGLRDDLVTEQHAARRGKVRTITHRQTWADVRDNLAPISSMANLVSSLDPMNPARSVLAIEHAATLFLIEHGEHLPRPDVLNRWTRRHHVRPDHVAHAAAVRYVPPAPCSYPGDSALTADGTEHFATVLRPTAEQRMTGQRFGWIGHERVTFYVALTVRDHRTVKRTKRTVTTPGAGKRGPARSPWSITDRAVRARITSDDQRATVAVFEQTLRTIAVGSRVMFGPVTVELLDGATVMVRDRVYPVRDACRRAVLDGALADDMRVFELAS